MLLALVAAISLLTLTQAHPQLYARYNPPNAQNVSITPLNSPYSCLTVNGPLTLGTPVVIEDCDYSKPNVYWLIVDGATYIKHATSEFCLDAGTNPQAGFYPHNGAEAKLLHCPSDNWPSPYDSPGTAKWEFSVDKFTLKGTNFCLDNADGETCNGNKVQIWDCHNGQGEDADHQVWGLIHHVYP